MKRPGRIISGPFQFPVNRQLRVNKRGEGPDPSGPQRYGDILSRMKTPFAADVILVGILSKLSAQGKKRRPNGFRTPVHCDPEFDLFCWGRYLHKFRRASCADEL